MAESSNEIEKIIKLVKQMEIVIRTSTNAGQVERVKKDMSRYQLRLKELVPDYNPDRETIDQLFRRLNTGRTPARAETEEVDQVPSFVSVPTAPVLKPGRADTTVSIADRIPEERASPHCTDPDVNFVSSVLRVLIREYWPAITEQHMKMDFTSGQERQTLRYKIDSVVRSQKTLMETIEEYATAEKADFREQLFKMKNKQIRLFLFEANDLFRDFKTLLGKLISEIQKGGTSISNPAERLHFDSSYEGASWLENHTIQEGITEFFSLVEYAIKKLNLPAVK